MTRYDYLEAFHHAEKCVNLLSKSRDQMSFANYNVIGNDDYKDETKTDNETMNSIRIFFKHSLIAIQEAQKIRNIIKDMDQFKDDFEARQKQDVLEFLEEKRKEHSNSWLYPAFLEEMRKSVEPQSLATSPSSDETEVKT